MLGRENTIEKILNILKTGHGQIVLNTNTSHEKLILKENGVP